MSEAIEPNSDETSVPWFSKHEEWIQKQIKQRRCFIFSSASGKEDNDLCICRYDKEAHDIKDGNKKWKKDVNTKTEPTNHFGTAIVNYEQASTETVDESDNTEGNTGTEVIGEEVNRTAGDEAYKEDEKDVDDRQNDVTEHHVQFIRVDEDTSMKHLKYLLFEVWSLTRPKWIFSLLGTKTEDDSIKHQLQDAFDTLSTTSDLWVLSDGLHGGVSEHIYAAKTDTIDPDRVASIGCYSWGHLWAHQDSFTVGETRERLLEFHLNNQDNMKMGGTTTHFILVDNGTSETYLCYLSHLSFYAKMIASLAASDDASSAIPAVAILHGGDQLIVLEGVKNLIKENLPVVIVKNSGGIADVMCKAFEESKGVLQTSIEDNKTSGHVTVIDERIKRRIKNDLSKRFEDEENTDESLQVIIQCLQRRDLITVVDFLEDETLFHGIISAIVKTKANADLNALVDEYLPTPAYSRKTKEKADKFVDKQKEVEPYWLGFYDSQNIIKEIFVEALLCEKTECVEFILETGGVDVTDFDIRDLFSKTNDDLQKAVRRILKETEDECKIKHVAGQIMEDDKRKHIFKRLYGFLKACRKDHGGKQTDVAILKTKGMKKQVASIVKESKAKDDLWKTIASILQKCQREFDLTSIPFPDGENDDNNNDSDDDLTGKNQRENTDDMLEISKNKGKEEIKDDEKERGQEEVETDFEEAIIPAFIKNIVKRFIPASCIKDEETDASEETAEDTKTKEAYRKLFLWAVLTNRRDIARVFWKRGQDLVVTALLAGTIMDTIAEMTYSSKKKAVREQSSKVYKQHCVGTIDACYLSDKTKTVKLLDRNTKKNIWNIDFLALAFERQNNGIFKSDGLIYYTYAKWIGDIPKDTSTWRIVVCTVFPFLIWLLIGTLVTKEDKISKTSPKNEQGTIAGDEAAENDQTNQTNGGQQDSQSKSNEEDLHGKKNNTTPSLFPRIFKRVGNFYSTPIVKFILSMIFYCVFLGLYAHFILVVLTLEFKWNWEIPLLVWVVAFFIEELIQILKSAIDSKEKKTKRRQRDLERTCIDRVFTTVSKYGGVYFQDKWNVLDCVCVIGFVIGYPLRSSAVTYSYGRLVLCINFMCFFWRLLQACTPSKTIGPMLYMVFRMVTDLVPFLVILFVAVFSYAIASEAILYPNSAWSVSFMFEIPRKAFWQIFGEFFFDDIKGDSCTEPPCPTEIGKTWVPFILAAYIIMTNVLLLNILIARFNHIFEDVRDKANEVWAWQKCRLMMEYESKPPFPLPFTILWRIASFIKWMISKCKNRTNKVEQKPLKGDEGDALVDATTEGNLGNDPAENGVDGVPGSLYEETGDVTNTPTVTLPSAIQDNRNNDTGTYVDHDERDAEVQLDDNEDGGGGTLTGHEEDDGGNEDIQPDDMENGDDDFTEEYGADVNAQSYETESDGEETEEMPQDDEPGEDDAGDNGTHVHEGQSDGNNEEPQEDEWDDWNEAGDYEPVESDYYYDYDYDYDNSCSESGDSYYEDEESDQEDPLDVFERRSAEYYLQTEKVKI